MSSDGKRTSGSAGPVQRITRLRLSVPLRLILLGGVVDLLPRQGTPLRTTDAKHANGVAIDHEDDAVDVRRLAKEDLAKIKIHLALFPVPWTALWIRV